MIDLLKTKASKKGVGLSNKVAVNFIFGILFVILALYTLLMIIMIAWAIMASLRDPVFDFFAGTTYKLPTKVNFDNYLLLFQGGRYKWDGTWDPTGYNMFQLYGNSLFYAFSCSFAKAFVDMMVAYVVARFSKKHHWLKIYLSIVLITMVIPIVGSTVSEIQMAKLLGIYGSVWKLWLMKANFLGMYFLIFYGMFRGMPDSYEEAAQIDGAGNFTICFKIYLPLALKTFSMVFLLHFITFWNDYSTPLYFLGGSTARDQHTLALFLYYLQLGAQGLSLTYTPVRLAGAVCTIVPTLLLFIFLNKYVMGSMSLGGLKE